MNHQTFFFRCFRYWILVLFSAFPPQDENGISGNSSERMYWIFLFIFYDAYHWFSIYRRMKFLLSLSFAQKKLAFLELRGRKNGQIVFDWVELVVAESIFLCLLSRWWDSENNRTISPHFGEWYEKKKWERGIDRWCSSNEEGCLIPTTSTLRGSPLRVNTTCRTVWMRNPGASEPDPERSLGLHVEEFLSFFFQSAQSSLNFGPQNIIIRDIFS